MKPIAVIGPMSLSTWAWIAAVTRGWACPSAVTAIPFAKSRYGRAVGVVQAMALAVAPRRAGSSGRGRASGCGAVSMRRECIAAGFRSRREHPGAPVRRPYDAAMVDFTLTDENRLVQRAASGPSPRPRSCRTSASGTRRARSIARSSRRWASWASSARRSRRRTAARGMDYLSFAILCEELERADTAFRVVQSVHVGLNSLALLQWGTEEQRQRWLVPQARGEKLATFGLTEPGVGTDAANLQTTARRDGDVLPPQRPEDLDLAGGHRRPLPRLRVGRPGEEAQGRDRVHARARHGRPDDRHAPRQARHPGRQHRAHQPRRRAGARSRTGSARRARGSSSR